MTIVIPCCTGPWWDGVVGINIEVLFTKFSEFFNPLMARSAIWRFDGITHVAMLR